jgi:septum site-determining protein MinC
MMLDDSHPTSAAPAASSDLSAGSPIVPSDLPQLELWTDAGVPVLRVPEGPGFEVLRACLREQLPRLRAQIGGRTLRLDFGVRDIVLFDLRRLLHLLKQEFTIEATGLYVRREVVHRFAERELKLKVFPTEPSPPPGAPFAAAPPAADPVEDARTEMFDAPAPAADAVVAEAAPAQPDAPPAPAPEVTAAAPAAVVSAPPTTPAPAPPREAPPAADPGGRRAQTVQRTLRSGTVLRFDGDLYVFGDVNPGAQIIATGNITVLGALKGTAHAGAGGDESAFILAFDLRPMQLRIGRTIAIPPDRKSDGGLDPEMAQVRDGQVVIEAWRRGR